MNDIKYIKITSKELDCGCFCSLVRCEKEFVLGEPVVQQSGNLFHPSCWYLFDEEDNCEVPSVSVDLDMENDDYYV